VWRGLAATTHPDRAKDGRYAGDILSKSAIQQIVDYINDTGEAGGVRGAYRSISLYHDWVKENNPSLDEAGFVVPGTAKLVQLEDGHWGAEVDFKINDFYHGDVSPTEIEYRIQNGSIAGLSIEYDTTPEYCKDVTHSGHTYRFINKLTEYAGLGFARARKIANPAAVIYKEIEEKVEEEKNMPEQDKTEEQPASLPESEAGLQQQEQAPEQKPAPDAAIQQKEKELAEREAALKVKEQELEGKKDLKIKEILDSKEFKDAVETELQVKSKAVKTDREENNMSEANLSVKEMNEALTKNDVLSFKEAASRFLSEKETDEKYREMIQTHGIPLRTTLQVKCGSDGKLHFASKLQVKDTLNTGSNTSAYTQNIVEFADMFIPGLVDTFNNQTNLFGATRKVPHIDGGDKYGWRITTSQKSSLSVDPDDNTVVKSFSNKVKLQTGIKEYRNGISVSDWTLHHSRASIGDLMAVEVDKAMRDLMRDINNDLFTEQGLETQNKVLGLEFVADSAGNTTLYGFTRSTTNRLAPAAAADTYQAIGGALTTDKLREAIRKVEVEGAQRGNLRLVTNPTQRDKLFELEDGALRYMNNAARMGFDGSPVYDGIPMIVDSSCQTDAIFVIDMESYYIVVSRPPQMVGLAKVGAAEEAYVTVYLAAVYEQPRRIHMLDTLTA
jgi:hypothetical protein